MYVFKYHYSIEESKTCKQIEKSGYDRESNPLIPKLKEAEMSVENLNKGSNDEEVPQKKMTRSGDELGENKGNFKLRFMRI